MKLQIYIKIQKQNNIQIIIKKTKLYIALTCIIKIKTLMFRNFIKSSDHKKYSEEIRKNS